MSLEAAITENTAAVRDLIAMLSNGVPASLTPPAGTAAPLDGAEKSTGTRGRRKNAAEGAADAKSEPAATGPDSNGNQAGTLYFFSEQHDSIYSRKPGDAEVNMADAVAITAEQFAEHTARLKAKYAVEQATKQAAAATTTAAAGVEIDPFTGQPIAAATPAAVVVTQKVMTDKLMEVANAPGKGREKVMEIIKAVGATSVPTVPEAKYTEAYNLAAAALAA